MSIETLNLRKNVWWMCMMVWVSLFSSCSVEDDLTPLGDEYLSLTFTKTLSRADLSQEGAGSFSEGDCIGLYVACEGNISYRELTLTGGEWYPRLKRSEFGKGRLTLSAHYPVLPESSRISPESSSFSVASVQSGTGKDASDLLFAQTVLEEGNYQSALTFNHVLHRLKIQLQNDVEDVEVFVRSKVDGKVNLLTGETSLRTDEYQWITPQKNTDGSLEAVIYPQEAAPYREGDGLLKIISQGKESFFKAPEIVSGGTVLSDFEAGKQVTIRLSLKESDARWANKKVWFHGITPPDEKEWKLLFPGVYSYAALGWKKEYGWFDCNKLNPTADPEGVLDGMMCWAATAANLLHWWMAQNKQYIELYGNKYKGPSWVYPSGKAQESDIFQCFVDAFPDKAGKGDEGVNWFIHGVTPSYPHHNPKIAGGFFKDVFPAGVRLGSDEGGLSKERFNEVVKDALSSKKAIGLSVGPITKGHVVTMWGAEFDENGDVSYIYYVDNNDRDYYEAYGGVGCFRKEVSYERYPEGGTYACYKTGYIGDDRPVTINRLIILDLGEKYWKQYLGIE